MLDCPGGAASLTAELNAMGGDVTACDPVYADSTAEQLATLTQAETDRANHYVRAHPEQYRWKVFANLQNCPRDTSSHKVPIVSQLGPRTAKGFQ